MKTVQGKYTDAVICTDMVEDYAIAQIKQLCNQEAFQGCKVRVMPDVHPGKVGVIGFTSTIGDKVMPAVVGIDMGCGMLLSKIRKGKTDFKKLDMVIRECVPSGFSCRRVMHRFAEDFPFEILRCVDHINRQRAVSSMGTLGGGNHFIELDRGEDGAVYVLIHTGSRHLGKEVAEYYLSEGQRYLKTDGIDVAYELTWLEGKLFEDYLHDMAVVQNFAAQNRLAILDEISSGMKWKMDDEIDCIHNYIDSSGTASIIRKGAVSAKEGDPVIIPINMKDGVIIGRGLGNTDWNMSAPHGAGRILSREQVRSSYTVSQFKKEMDGIYCSCVGKGILDEAPFAYRGIQDIKPLLSETVEVTEILTPIYNYKAGNDGK